MQYTLDGDYVATYSSTFQAQKHTGISSGNLSHVASGTRKTAGGFIWKWVTENKGGTVDDRTEV